MNESHSMTKEELKIINVPTLVFNGGAKDVVPINEAEFISSNIKDSKLVILEKAGHCNYIINNATFYDELNSFLVK